MGSEDKVYEWAKEKMKLCPGSSSLTKADLKQAYKGPMKEVLNSMAKCLRSTEDVNKVRNFTREQTIKDLLQRKAAAESVVETLKAENAALEEKCSELEVKESKINSTMGKAAEKKAILEKCANLTKNQCEAVKGLKIQAKLLGQKISPEFCKNNETSSSESSGFIFNPNHNKLESILKGEVRKIVEEISSKKNCDEISDSVLQMVSKYPGQERWKVMLELQNELAAQADETNQSVCLQKDAEALSKELENADSGTDIVRPLQRHLDALTLEHAGLMMKRLHRAKKIKTLEQQLNDLLIATPEAKSEVEETIRNAQAAQLHKSLAKLISQNQSELSAQSETSKNILQIHNFTQETENRKNKIVALLGLLQDAAHLTDQLQTENKERSQEVKMDLESLSQLPDTVQTKLSLLSQNTQDYFFEKIQTVSTCVSLNDDVVMDIINTKSRLRFLKSHLDAINQEDSPTSKANEYKIEEIRKSIEEQETTLQRNVCKFQQSFTKEQEKTTQNLAEQLKFWKENPIVEQLISDKTIMVSGMTLADWMEYTEQSLASGN